MITISRECSFEYAHRLHEHKGKCFNIHGHEGKIVWHLRGPVDPKTGMIIDFYEIKSKLDKWIDDNWDHRLLICKHDPFCYDLVTMKLPGVIVLDCVSTSENLAALLRNDLNKEFFADSEVELFRVDFWETSNAYATSEA